MRRQLLSSLRTPKNLLVSRRTIWTSIKHTVCVTGASGFVGSQIVKHLLKDGYEVRAAVRDVDDGAKNAHLKKLQNKYHALDLVSIPDIMKPEGFSRAFSSCKYVIHSASPVFLDSSDENDFIPPAVEGTKMVLNEAKKAGVQRVVFTSTMATICGSQRNKNSDHVWSEEDWNDEPASPYSKSKVMAEKAAWEFHEETGLELATIHPSFVVGPFLPERVVSSAKVMMPLLRGEHKNGAKLMKFGLVDVRDVAVAHIKAMTTPEANGQRYLVSDKDQYATMDLVELIQKHFVDLYLPKEYEDKKMHTSVKNSADNRKVKQLMGVDSLISAEVALKDFVQSLKDNGFL